MTTFQPIQSIELLFDFVTLMQPKPIFICKNYDCFKQIIIQKEKNKVLYFFTMFTFGFYYTYLSIPGSMNEFFIEIKRAINQYAEEEEDDTVQEFIPLLERLMKINMASKNFGQCLFEFEKIFEQEFNKLIKILQVYMQIFCKGSNVDKLLSKNLPATKKEINEQLFTTSPSMISIHILSIIFRVNIELYLLDNDFVDLSWRSPSFYSQTFGNINLMWGQNKCWAALYKSSQYPFYWKNNEPELIKCELKPDHIQNVYVHEIFENGTFLEGCLKNGNKCHFACRKCLTKHIKENSTKGGSQLIIVGNFEENEFPNLGCKTCKTRVTFRDVKRIFGKEKFERYFDKYIERIKKYLMSFS